MQMFDGKDLRVRRPLVGVGEAVFVFIRSHVVDRVSVASSGQIRPNLVSRSATTKLRLQAIRSDNRALIGVYSTPFGGGSIALAPSWKLG
ncbi:hypothetical protein L484_015496 [Morus notabilis]|uniref:Uncharacterized protein n=1 Tax=Morus notabilis TaxID=981085 RepID=W9RJC2_9ROSA|nr:hypothetical protein L484_015496 [Morus notabilis]